MGLLDTINGPADLKALRRKDLGSLAEEIRAYLIDCVSRTGGHLGPNLGVVELTMAIHRVFDSPRDTVVFDTGHQSYVHKLLTGRHDFSALKKQGGLSGYPSRTESEHDVVENSHASASLSWAIGIATGRRLRGERDRHTVAVIGDGALTGGMAWEALNNIAANPDLPLVIVINDNEWSYAPTLGGMADYLASLRATRGYENVLGWGKRNISRTPVVGQHMYDALHGVKKGIKDIVSPQGMFEDLGLKYLGPVDGHDLDALETAMRRARDFRGVVLVHALTEKGHGYEPATVHEADRFHTVGVINPETGLPLEVSGRSWTDDFSDELLALGQERRDIVAVTASMLIPVGLAGFAERFPDRVFDVGIAEQHAVTMASGMSFAGLHPIVAIYATFLNRAFDQLLLDCALHKQGVTFVLDRAGVTGSDGASHNGMWDMSLAAIIPGLRLAAPRDGGQIVTALREAVDVDDGPTVLRFPKGNTPAIIPAIRTEGGVDVLSEDSPAPDPCDILIVAVGAMATTGLQVAEKLRADGFSARVIDPRWVLPVSPGVIAQSEQTSSVAVIEDNVVGTGIGASIAEALTSTRSSPCPTWCYGIAQEFLDHGSRSQVLERVGLTPDSIATSLIARLRSRARAV